MEIWIVEEYDYGEGSYHGTETLGLFSTREKAENFVSRKFPSWKQRYTSEYESSYERSAFETLTVSVYSKILDSEDE